MEGLIFGILRYVTGETLNLTAVLTSTPKGYHRSLRGASMNIKSYLLLYQIGTDREKILINDIVFLDVSLNNTVNSLQKLSLPYKELLF